MKSGSRIGAVSALLVSTLGALSACTAILGIDSLPDPDEPSMDAATSRDGGSDAATDGAADATVTTPPDAADGAADADAGPQTDGLISFSEQATAIPIPPLGVLEGRDLRFGESLALSPDGTWLAIGAPGAGRSDSDAGLTGQVQLVRIAIDGGAGGTLTVTLLDHGPPDPGPLDPPTVGGGGFGRSLAFSADGMYLAVGAPQEPHLGASTAGNVRVYRLDADVWSYLVTLQPLAGTATWFGNAVAFNGASTATANKILFIGATGAPPFGDGGMNPYQASVTAYPFVDGGFTPTPQYAVTSQQTNDGFGWSIASSTTASVIVVGAPFTGATEDGRIYLMSLGHFVADEAFPYSASLAGGSQAQFGSSVGLSFDRSTAVIGAPSFNGSGAVVLWGIDAGASGPAFNVNVAEVVPSPDASVALDGAALGSSVAVDQARVLLGGPLLGGGVALQSVLRGPYSESVTSLAPEVDASPPGARYGTALATILDGGLVAISAPGSGAGGPAPLVYLTR